MSDYEGVATITEGTLLKVGQAVARQVALTWFAEKKAASRRGRDLTKLIRARFPIRRAERDVLDALVSLEDDVADQLAPGLAGAAHGLPNHEREAAYEAVSDAFEDIDLSDSALFGVDLDPTGLASVVRSRKPVEQVGLSERAIGLYDVALDRACVVLAHHGGTLRCVRAMNDWNVRSAGAAAATGVNRAWCGGVGARAGGVNVVVTG